jgi:Uma2 family endonuclease
VKDFSDTLPAPLPFPVPRSAIPTEPIYRLSVEQYHAMIEAGILHSGDHVELIHGWLVHKIRKTPAHSVVTHLLYDLFETLNLEGWHIATQDPVTLSDSEPEPDGSLVRGEFTDYHSRHPGPEEVALVVEVADGTVTRDREIRKPLYASARIPVYWIVNLEEDQLEFFTDPTGPAGEPDYRRQHVLGPADEVPVIVNGREVARIAVRDMLP